MKILKWPLLVVDRQVLEMPLGAQVLAVQAQHGVPTIWALCPDWEKRESRVFFMYGTGHEIAGVPLNGYVGTAQCGEYEWHVFDAGVERDD